MRTLEHLLPLAIRSHNGTSFDPDKRGNSIIEDYSAELDEDLKTVLDPENYKAKYIQKLSSWLSAKSNCISTMITGGSNFPVRRAEKANASEHKRYEEFRQWREYAFKSNAKQIEAKKSPEQKLDEKWQSIKNIIDDKAATIFSIDNGTNRYTMRSLIVSNLTGFIQRIAKSGDTTNLLRSLEYIKTLNTCIHATKPLVTANNSIWKLGEVAEAKREAQFDKGNQDSTVVLFEGGKIIFNYAIDRIQIAHDRKPEYTVIQDLKKKAFKWSPSNMVWQRQLTDNAIYATSQLTGISYSSLKSA